MSTVVKLLEGVVLLESAPLGGEETGDKKPDVLFWDSDDFLHADRCCVRPRRVLKSALPHI